MQQSSAASRIDPRRVLGQRRRLSLADIDSVLAEALRLRNIVQGGNTVRADLAGPEVRLVHLANMTLGQALGHLGLTLRASVDGLGYQFPLPMRLLARMMKRSFLAGGMAAPFQQPPKLNRLITPPFDTTADEGLATLQDCVAAFRGASRLQPNALLGPLERVEWVALTCRHAEWHLSFMIER